MLTIVIRIFYSCNVFNAQWLSLKDYSLVFYELLLVNLIDNIQTTKGKLRTTIKDTWTKPSWGGIRGGKWGWLAWLGVVVVNGDNCTSTTIKKKFTILESD